MTTAVCETKTLDEFPVVVFKVTTVSFVDVYTMPGRRTPDMTKVQSPSTRETATSVAIRKGSDVHGFKNVAEIIRLILSARLEGFG